MLKGAEYMNIAEELEMHAGEELQHALTIAKQIDYLGGMPTVTPKPVKTSEKAEDMLRFDLDNENETIRNYRERVRQCEALGEYAMAEQIREILVQEQEHQIDLATAAWAGDVPRDVKQQPEWPTTGHPGDTEDCSRSSRGSRLSASRPPANVLTLSVILAPTV